MSSNPPVHKGANPLRILILEDDIDLARQWLKAFDPHPIAATHVWSCEEAKTLCTQETFDLVVCDIFIQNPLGELLPKGGYSLLSFLRENIHSASPSWGRTVPVIMVTGAKMAIEYNIFNFTAHWQGIYTMKKPFATETLVQKVLSILQPSPSDTPPGTPSGTPPEDRGQG